jgi:hypothetical protein
MGKKGRVERGVPVGVKHTESEDDWRDGDRLIRLAVAVIKFLGDTAIAEGKGFPSSGVCLIESEALNYAVDFYSEMYIGGKATRRLDKDEVRKWVNEHFDGSEVSE